MYRGFSRVARILQFSQVFKVIGAKLDFFWVFYSCRSKRFTRNSRNQSDLSVIWLFWWICDGRFYVQSLLSLKIPVHSRNMIRSDSVTCAENVQTCANKKFEKTRLAQITKQLRLRECSFCRLARIVKFAKLYLYPHFKLMLIMFGRPRGSIRSQITGSS